MMQFIESTSQPKNLSINFTSIEEIEPKVEVKLESITQTRSVIASNHLAKVLATEPKAKHTKSRVRVKREFKAYQKEILELAKIDKEILALNSEIERLDNHTNSNPTNSSIALNSSKIEANPKVQTSTKPIVALNSKNTIINNYMLENCESWVEEETEKKLNISV